MRATHTCTHTIGNTHMHTVTHTHTGGTVTWTQTQTYQLHPIICHSVTVALQFSPLTWMQSQTLLHQLHHIVCHSVTSATLYTSHWNAAINLASSIHLEKQCPHALSKCFVLCYVSWHLVSWRHITFKASRSHVSGLSMNPSAHHIFCFCFSVMSFDMSSEGIQLSPSFWISPVQSFHLLTTFLFMLCHLASANPTPWPSRKYDSSPIPSTLPRIPSPPQQKSFSPSFLCIVIQQ